MIYAEHPKTRTVYRRVVDDARFVFDRDPVPGDERLGVPAFYRGWTALGPKLVGKLVGAPGGWPHGFEEIGPATGRGVVGLCACKLGYPHERDCPNYIDVNLDPSPPVSNRRSTPMTATPEIRPASIQPRRIPIKIQIATVAYCGGRHPTSPISETGER